MCSGNESPDKDSKEMCMCVFVYICNTKISIPICIELCEEFSSERFWQ